MRRLQTAEAVSTNEVFISPANSAVGTPMTMDEDEDEEMCIDDPARHLYVIERGEHKPFKCPVIGCDKTYKNQNGLKYHRIHGHQNQTLHLNDDGTYSVIDPLSNAPYPEGVEFEKDKPYRCEVCGKRYKNLNGLKYHRGHSTHWFFFFSFVVLKWRKRAKKLVFVFLKKLFSVFFSFRVIFVFILFVFLESFFFFQQKAFFFSFNVLF